MEGRNSTKDHNEDPQVLDASECLLTLRNMPADKKQPSLSSESTKAQNGKDGQARLSPEKCVKTDQQISSVPYSNSLSPTSKGGHSLTSSTNKTLSPQSSTITSTSSLPSSGTARARSATNTVPAVSPGINTDTQDGTRAKAKPGTSMNSACLVHVSDDSSSSEVETAKKTGLTPTSPPDRATTPGTTQVQPVASSRLSRIRQNHLASKKKEQMKAGNMKLPELSEHSELEISSLPPRQASSVGSTTSVSEHISNAKSQISAQDRTTETPPAPSDDPVTPSMPDTFLKKLGLTFSSSCFNENSVDQLSEKEVESKFVSLSLAFKTDKLTLDQRISVQERARDLAEKNVDVELLGLKEAVETLSELVTDSQVRNVIQRIKQHISVLEQSAARVSSRAEVFGAVQQERRICKAMEVMVLYTENLRRIREKEESELQEARKLLSERSGTGFGLESDSGSNRRSMSVCGFNSLGRPTRRRSEVALPRVLGGMGSPSLTPTGTLDAKTRFQSAVASTSMQQAITTTMRRYSLEKQRSSSISSPAAVPTPLTLPSSGFMRNASPSNLTVTRQSETDGRNDSCGEKTETANKVSQEEEAFRKGFEEGLKAKLSQELNDLRDQQNSLNQSLEGVMDKVEQSQIKDEEYLSRPSWLETTLLLIFKVGNYILQYDWKSNKTAIRNLAGVFFVLLAIFAVLLCPSVTTGDVTHFVKSP